jgi:hypothetical protein
MSLNRYYETCESFFQELGRYDAAYALRDGLPRERYIAFHNIQALIWAAGEGYHFYSLLLAQIREEDIQDMIEDITANP